MPRGERVRGRHLRRSSSKPMTRSSPRPDRSVAFSRDVARRHAALYRYLRRLGVPNASGEPGRRAQRGCAQSGRNQYTYMPTIINPMPQMSRAVLTADNEGLWDVAADPRRTQSPITNAKIGMGLAPWIAATASKTAWFRLGRPRAIQIAAPTAISATATIGTTTRRSVTDITL